MVDITVYVVQITQPGRRWEDFAEHADQDKLKGAWDRAIKRVGSGNVRMVRRYIQQTVIKTA